MTVAAMEALDRIEAWLLDHGSDKTIAPLMEDIDVIRAEFPATPPAHVPTKRADNESMLICAVRYAQGRRSYVVSEASGWVRERWPTLSPGTRNVIWRDLQRFLDLGKTCPEVLGMKMDAREWTELATWIEAQP